MLSVRPTGTRFYRGSYTALGADSSSKARLHGDRAILGSQTPCKENGQCRLISALDDSWAFLGQSACKPFMRNQGLQHIFWRLSPGRELPLLSFHIWSAKSFQHFVVLFYLVFYFSSLTSFLESPTLPSKTLILSRNYPASKQAPIPMMTVTLWSIDIPGSCLAILTEHL